MQILKDNIRSRILDVAKQQFELKGYSKTSMREIAVDVGVGVGNIYNYFKSKDELFHEVVRPVLYALEMLLQEHHGIQGEDIMMMRSEEYLETCINEYISLYDTHHRLMKILLFRAQGSSLECFRENYTDRSTELVKVWFTVMQRKYPMINIAIPDFIIHLHTVWMFTMFEELLRHSIAKQEMKAILHNYILFDPRLEGHYSNMTGKICIYRLVATVRQQERRKSLRRFPPFFMNKFEYRSLIIRLI